MIAISALLQDQIAYYKARSGEYDRWFLRQDRYDCGPDDNAAWFREVDDVRAALDNFKPKGRVLEFAGGTGLWTERLVPHAELIHVLDASEETAAINRARCASGKVHYTITNIFEWVPQHTHDVVFFGFWLSHVPPELLDHFLSLVSRCLKPGGRVFFVDSKREQGSTARDHILPEPNNTIARRKLNDGRTFDIVKIFYEPDALTARFADHGLIASIAETNLYFIYGSATKS